MLLVRNFNLKRCREPDSGNELHVHHAANRVDSNSIIQYCFGPNGKGRSQTERMRDPHCRCGPQWEAATESKGPCQWPRKSKASLRFTACECWTCRALPAMHGPRRDRRPLMLGCPSCESLRVGLEHSYFAVQGRTLYCILKITGDSSILQYAVPHGLTANVLHVFQRLTTQPRPTVRCGKCRRCSTVPCTASYCKTHPTIPDAPIDSHCNHTSPPMTCILRHRHSIPFRFRLLLFSYL